jgi:hypothetical protein
MPAPRSLNIGDRTRILRVPENDLRQRERELAEKTEMAGWTADSIERIIEQSPIVTIARIDEYGCVWYDASIIGPEGTEEKHSLIVYDDDTWERLDTLAKLQVVMTIEGIDDNRMPITRRTIGWTCVLEMA